ncbi:polymer-forming cytoskeletal protein [Patescibacteria group bacterium]|nr:polymer-forming cytoskeletal protein [Patescibacteria group bacterium]
MFNKNQDISTSKNIETIIGPSVKVEGDFRGEGDLIIEGILIGNLQTKNNLKIGQNAIVEAEIKANNAFISGKIKGNITVKGKLEITSTAIILGDIKAQIISIESGALLKGKLEMPVGNLKSEDLKTKDNTQAEEESEENDLEEEAEENK